MFKDLIKKFNYYTAWLRKDSRIVVRNGQGLINGNKIYSVSMASPDPETKTYNVITKDTNVTNFPELSGCDDVTISTDFISDIIAGIDNWFEMDVYSRCQQVDDRGEPIGEAILVSVFNPTIGCPYAYIQTTGGFFYQATLYENHSVDLMMGDGRTMRITRDSDSDCKEWKVDVDN
jgi:hypothetical protein